MAKVWAITVKGEETGVDGIRMYRWATEDQFQSIMEMLQDDSKKNAWVMLGDRPIQISRIVDFKPMDLDYAKSLPSFSKVVLDRIEEEKKLGIGDWEEPKQINAEGLARLEEMKQKFRLDKGVE